MVVRSIDSIPENSGDINWEEYSGLLSEGIWSDYQEAVARYSDPSESEEFLQDYLEDLRSKSATDFTAWLILEDMLVKGVTQIDNLMEIVSGITTSAAAAAGSAVVGLIGAGNMIVGSVVGLTGIVNSTLGAGLGELADYGLFSIPGVIDLTPAVEAAAEGIESFGDWQQDVGVTAMKVGSTMLLETAPDLAMLSLYSLYQIPDELKENMDDQAKYNLLMAQTLDELNAGLPYDEVQANHIARYEEADIGVQFVPNMGNAVGSVSIITGTAGVTSTAVAASLVGASVNAYFDSGGHMKDKEDVEEQDVLDMISAASTYLEESKALMVEEYGPEAYQEAVASTLEEINDPSSLTDVVDTANELIVQSQGSMEQANLNSVTRALVAALKQQIADDTNVLIISTEYGSESLYEWGAANLGYSWPLSDDDLNDWVSKALRDYSLSFRHNAVIDEDGVPALSDGSPITVTALTDTWMQDSDDTTSDVSPAPTIPAVPEQRLEDVAAHYVGTSTLPGNWLNAYNDGGASSPVVGDTYSWFGFTYTVTGTNDDGRVQNWMIEKDGEAESLSFAVDYEQGEQPWAVTLSNVPMIVGTSQSDEEEI